MQDKQLLGDNPNDKSTVSATSDMSASQLFIPKDFQFKPVKPAHKDLDVTAGDMFKAVGSGALRSVAGFGELSENLFGVGESLRDLANSGADSLTSSMTEDGQAAVNSRLLEDNENGNPAFSDASGDIDVWAMKIADGLGSLVTNFAGGGGAGFAAKVALKNTIAKSMLKKGFGSEAAGLIADKAISISASTGAVATGMGTSLGGASLDAYNATMALDSGWLAENSDYFKQAALRLSELPENEGKSATEIFDLAKEETARYASAQMSTDPTAVAASVAGAMGDKYLFGALLGKMGKGAVSGGFKGALSEGGTEFIEGYGQTVAQNQVLNDVTGQDIDPTEGAMTNALEGALIGGALGAPIGTVGGAISKRTQTDDDQDVNTPTETPTPAPDVDGSPVVNAEPQQPAQEPEARTRRPLFNGDSVKSYLSDANKLKGELANFKTNKRNKELIGDLSSGLDRHTNALVNNPDMSPEDIQTAQRGLQNIFTQYQQLYSPEATFDSIYQSPESVSVSESESVAPSDGGNVAQSESENVATQQGTPAASGEVQTGTPTDSATNSATHSDVVLQQQRISGKLKQLRAQKPDSQEYADLDSTIQGYGESLNTPQQVENLQAVKSHFDVIELAVDGELNRPDTNQAVSPQKEGQTTRQALVNKGVLPERNREQEVIDLARAWDPDRARDIETALRSDSISQTEADKLEAEYENMATQASAAGVDPLATNFDRRVESNRQDMANREKPVERAARKGQEYDFSGSIARRRKAIREEIQQSMLPEDRKDKRKLERMVDLEYSRRYPGEEVEPTEQVDNGLEQFEQPEFNRANSQRAIESRAQQASNAAKLRESELERESREPSPEENPNWFGTNPRTGERTTRSYMRDLANREAQSQLSEDKAESERIETRQANLTNRREQLAEPVSGFGQRPNSMKMREDGKKPIRDFTGINAKTTRMSKRLRKRLNRAKGFDSDAVLQELQQHEKRLAAYEQAARDRAEQEANNPENIKRRKSAESLFQEYISDPESKEFAESEITRTIRNIANSLEQSPSTVLEFDGQSMPVAKVRAQLANGVRTLADKYLGKTAAMMEGARQKKAQRDMEETNESSRSVQQRTDEAEPESDSIIEQARAVIRDVIERNGGPKPSMKGVRTAYRDAGFTANELQDALGEQSISAFERQVKNEVDESSKQNESSSTTTVASSDVDTLTSSESDTAAPSESEKVGKSESEIVATSEGGKESEPSSGQAQVTEEEGRESDNEQSSLNGQPQKAVIDDFGEVLHGARKHNFGKFGDALMREVSDEQVKAEPLSKLLPKPNLEKLHKEGISKFNLALMVWMRGKIPSKPRGRYTRSKLERWAQGVKNVRDLSRMILDGDVDGKHVTALEGVMGQVIEQISPDLTLEQIETMGNYEADYYNIANEYIFKRKKAYYGDAIRAGSLDELVAKVRDHFNAHTEAKAKASPKSRANLSVYSNRYTGEVFIGIKVGSRVVNIKSGFENTRQAREYLGENQVALEDEVIARRAEARQEVRSDSNRPREGVVERESNVTPEDFSKAFGFRGVQFGNWVEGKRRQQDLNNAYDSLIDLARLMGVSTRALSLGGKLGLAFGARGQGGRSSAAAHFEPGTFVINLTKVHGKGSLAHEWFHALDYHFGKGTNVSGRSRAEAMEGIRPEMAEKWNNIKKAIKASDLPSRSDKRDELRSKAYWNTDVELVARAFESWVIEQNSHHGVTNDYLANVLPESNQDDYPYPTATEMEQGISAAYSDFANALQEQEGENGQPVLYSLNDQQAALVDSEPTVNDVKGFVKSIFKGSPDLAHVETQVDVVSSEQDMPSHVQAQIERDGVQGNVNAIFDPHTQRVYLVASKAPTKEHAERFIFHELVGHYGLRRLFGEDLNKELVNIRNLIGGKSGTLSLARKMGVDLGAYVGITDKAIANNEISTEQADHILFEELLAHVAETKRVSSALDRLLVKVKEWLRRHGFATLAKYGESDVLELLTNIRNSLNTPISGGKRNSNTTPSEKLVYSQDNDFKSELAQAMKSLKSRVSPVKVTDTPAVLEALGVPALPITITRDAVRKATNGQKDGDHAVSMAVIEKLPELLTDPIAVFTPKNESIARTGSKNIWIEATLENGKPILIILHASKTERNIKINRIASAYGKDENALNAWGRDGLLEYVRSKNPEWLRQQGLQLPEGRTYHRGSKKIVLTKGDIVNKGRVNYSLSDKPSASNIFFSRGSTDAGHTKVNTGERPFVVEGKRAAVDAIVQSSLRELGLKDFTLRFETVDTESDLPDYIKSYIDDANANGEVYGLYDGREHKVWVVAEKHKKPSDVEQTVYHEIAGHVGLDRLLKEAGAQPDINTLAMQLGGIKGITRFAEENGINLTPYLNAANKLTREQADKMLVHELVAHMAEKKKFAKPMQRILAKIRRFFRDRLGFIWSPKFNNDELMDLVFRAKKTLENPPPNSRERFTDDALYFSRNREETSGKSDYQPTMSVDQALAKRQSKIFRSIKQALYGTPVVGETLDAIGRKKYMMLTLRQMAEVAGWINKPLGKRVDNYLAEINKMTATQNTLAEQAADVAKELHDWAKKNRADADKLFSFAHEATLADTDPSEAFQSRKEDLKKSIAKHERIYSEEGGSNTERGIAAFKQKEEDKKALENEDNRRREHVRLRNQWGTLNKEQQRRFRQMRDHYIEQSAKMNEALEKQIERAVEDSKLRKAMIAELRQQQERAAKGLYFPLSRHGDYWIDFVDENDERQFMMFETKGAMDLNAQKLRDAGFHINTGMKAQTNESQKTSLPFVAEVLHMINDSKNTNMSDKLRHSLTDEIYQMYLRTLPGRSIRRNFIHRKGVAGFSQDAVRALADQGFKQSRQQARLDHMDILDNHLDGIQKYVDKYYETYGNEMPNKVNADRMVEELNKRHEWVRNPARSAWAQKLTSLGFVWLLGFTPAAALVNLTQLVQIAIPVLGSQHGAYNASKEIGRASKEFLKAASMKGRNKKHGFLANAVTGSERLALLEAIKLGAIDTTQASDLAGLAENPNAKYSGGWNKFMNFIGYMFHHAEVFNREVTFLAAYRLAKEKLGDHDKAVEQAIKDTFDSHYDYSSLNRARFMQSDIAAVGLQFKQYSQNTTYYLWSNAIKWLKGESPEVKAMAKKQLLGTLAATFLIGGVGALPLSLLVGVINGAEDIFGDDDEPFDVETELKAMLSGAFGKDAAAFMWHGSLPSIGGRISLDDLWIRSLDREIDPDDAYIEFMKQAAGPVLGGIAVSWTQGLNDMTNEHYLRGIEKMTPKTIRDVIKTARFIKEEGIATRTGSVVVDDLSGWDLVGQATGFSVGRANIQYDENNAIKNYEQHVQKRRQRLMNSYYTAFRLKDKEAITEVMSKIKHFNKSEYGRLNPISNKNLQQSVKARQRNLSKTDNGLQVSPKLQRLVAEYDIF
jgi:hypothetical protein